MKKNLILLSALIASLTLTSCGNSNENGGESSDIGKILETMRKGFEFNADIDETATFYSGDPTLGGTLTDETSSYEANLKTVFENNDKTTGFEAVLSHKEDGEDVIDSNEVYVLGDDGRVYTNTLTPQNTVEQDVMLDANGSSNLNYSVYFDNPFNHILESDITHVEGNTYKLSNNKASYFSSQYLNAADPIFSGVLSDTTLTIENGELKEMVVTPVSITESEVDYSTTAQEVVFFEISAVATLTFTECGTAEITKPTPYATQSYHTPLQNAFNRLGLGNNFTYSITFSPVVDGNAQVPSTLVFYFTSGAVFFQAGNGLAPVANSDVLLRYAAETGDITPYGYDIATQTWTAAAALRNGFSSLIGSNYQYVHIPFDTYAAEVFTQAEGSSDYVAVPEVTDYLGLYLLPEIIAGSSYARYLAYGSKITAKLDSTNSYLTNIDVDFYYESYISVYSGSYNIEISDYGTTVLPFDIQ